MIRTETERQFGRSVFGSDAAGYDAGRPGYPQALWELLGERCGLGAGARVFEIGPGTGQATRQLIARGGSVTAIEPDPELCRVLAGKVADTRLAILNAPFGSAPLDAEGYDLGVAATSYGWLDPQSEHARIAAALRPGGWWAMWWNVFQDVRSDPILEAAVLDTVRHRGTAPDGQHYALRTGERLAELERIGLVDVEHRMLDHRVELTPASLRALYATFSPLRALAPGERERRLDRVEAMAEAEAVEGRIERHFRVPLYLARKPARQA